MAIKVLEVDEERIPKEKPPSLLPIQPGREGDIVIESLPKMTHFEVFGRKKVMPPRSVTLMSRIESVKVVDEILGSGQREERKLLPLAWDHPEDIYRYWNYAKLAKGRVLVYRLGLGLFTRMVHRPKSMFIIEPDIGIKKLVFPSILWQCADIAIDTDAGVVDKLPGKYAFDFVFIDPVPYTGKSDTMLTVSRLPELNQLIARFKKCVVPGGVIAVRGYRELVLKYQAWCQSEIFNLLSWNDLWSKEPPPREVAIEQMFVEWAFKNKKRILRDRDYKFLNAWARNTAMTVVK